MIIQKLLPGVLKEILTHVPTVLFKVVDWQELMQEIPKVSKKILQKEGFEELFKKQIDLVNPFEVTLSMDVPVSQYIPNKESGDRLLEIYFSQLFSPNGVFLDLRAHHFSSLNKNLHWHPSGLWCQFEESFRQGLIKVYRGFYFSDNQEYLSGLRDIGMLDDKWGEEDKSHLANLFRSHFGSALEEEMTFSLDHFKDSIFKVSNFMLKKEVSISKDFLYLGIYLVTLYSHLEQTRSTHPVKEIFLKTASIYLNTPSKKS